MKKTFCLITALFLLFCGCSRNQPANQVQTEGEFIKLENGKLLSPSGEEYGWVAPEGYLVPLGETVFQAGVKGEVKTSSHLGVPYQTGLFSIHNDDTYNILIRHEPNNEFCSIYRKTSLPPVDFSVDNCIRLELVLGGGYPADNSVHKSCGGGISDQTDIAAFLSDVRLQKDPREAGLYDLIRKPDGSLENCHLYGAVYGFFEEEPNLAIRMDIDSYNDLAYSISIDGRSYVLPEAWLQQLQDSCCQGEG